MAKQADQQRKGGAAAMRRYTFKLYPTPAQAAAMEEHRRLHCALYNAALQQRIEAYRRQGKTLTANDQSREVTALRAECPEYANMSSDSIRLTLDRLDLAMKAFFRRAKAGAGASSGFPRFKRGDDYPGFSFPTCTTKDRNAGRPRPKGWRFTVGEGNRNGRLYMIGVPGLVKARGSFPGPVELKHLDVLWRYGAWWASYVVEIAPRRACGYGDGLIKLDLITSFGAVTRTNGGCAAGPEAAVSTAVDGRITLHFEGYTPTSGAEAGDLSGDRNVEPRLELSAPGAEAGDLSGDRNLRLRKNSTFNGAEAGDLSVLHIQQAMSRCKRGSCRYRALKRRKSRAEWHGANRRKHRLHNFTAAVVREFRTLTVIKPPSFKDLTASGRGDARDHGAMVGTKATLNRRILDMAPAMTVAMLEYKLAEAGGALTTIEDAAPAAAVGNALVTAKKVARRLTKKAKAA